jgi:nitroreductase
MATIPETAVTTDLFRRAVAGAVRAPSMHNVQPWRFRLAESAIEVRIDTERSLPATDAEGWGARVACGAAVTNIWLVLADAGIRPEVSLFPDPDDRRLAATVRAAGPHHPAPYVATFCQAIPERHSNRRPFFDVAVSQDSRYRLEAAAVRLGAWLRLVWEPSEIVRVAEIIRSADDALRRDQRYADELKAWSRAEHRTEAGVSASAAGVAPAGQDLLAMRDFGGIHRADGRDFEAWPLLAVLGTRGGSARDDVLAGMALQEVLLTATVDRLATSMLSQPMEVPDARQELTHVVHHIGWPQMVLRIGYGQPTGTSDRRPIDDVID